MLKKGLYEREREAEYFYGSIHTGTNGHESNPYHQLTSE